MPSKIPPSNLPPESQRWGREQETRALRQSADVSSFLNNSMADYKQMNAASTASMAQVDRLLGAYKQIPVSTTEQVVVNSFNLPAASWTVVADIGIQFPARLRYHNAIATIDVSLDVGVNNPQIWFSVSAANGNAFENIMATIGDVNTYYKVAHASSARFVDRFFTPESGADNSRLSLWCANAVSFTGTAVLTSQVISRD